MRRSPARGCGGVRSRPRQRHAGVERRGRLPGDPWYRDFHRDIGFDLPAAALRPFVPGEQPQPDRPQVPSHHRRHAAQGAVRPGARARSGSAAHAAHFVEARRAQVDWLCAHDGPPAGRRLPVRRRALRPLVVRGRRLARGRPPTARRHPGAGRDDPVGRPRPPSRRCSARRRRRARGVRGDTTPSGSDRENDWIYPHLHAHRASASRALCRDVTPSGRPASRRALIAGAARAPPRPGERLGVHDGARDHGRVRDPAHDRPPAPLSAALRRRRAAHAIDESALAALEERACRSSRRSILASLD